VIIDVSRSFLHVSYSNHVYIPKRTLKTCIYICRLLCVCRWGRTLS